MWLCRFAATQNKEATVQSVTAINNLQWLSASRVCCLQSCNICDLDCVRRILLKLSILKSNHSSVMENLALVPVHSDVATTMPSRLAIGTRKAFTNNYEFRYEFNPTVGGFFCQQTTEFGLGNEVMAIFCIDLPDGTWHVAMEGLIEEGAFQPRQMVFRTQASFWDPGSHQWQVNKSRSKDPVASDPDWDQEWLLNAETRLPSWVVELLCQWHPVVELLCQWHPVVELLCQWHPVVELLCQWHPVVLLWIENWAFSLNRSLWRTIIAVSKKWCTCTSVQLWLCRFAAIHKSILWKYKSRLPTRDRLITLLLHFQPKFFQVSIAGPRMVLHGAQCKSLRVDKI